MMIRLVEPSRESRIYSGSAVGASCSYIEYGEPEKMIPITVSLHFVHDVGNLNPLVSRTVAQPWLCYSSISIECWSSKGNTGTNQGKSSE